MCAVVPEESGEGWIGHCWGRGTQVGMAWLGNSPSSCGMVDGSSWRFEELI